MRKSMGKIAMILGLAVGLTACGAGQSAQPSSGQASGGQQAGGGGGPVEIRLGGGFSSEEPLWLMQVDPSLTPHQGKSYTLNITQFRANADRLNAYQANQIDIASIGQGATLVAASQGIPLKVVASVIKETPGKGFNTLFMASKDSGINSIADVKGKVIGIPDFKSPTDMWARAAIRSAGMDPDKDVKYAIIPIPSMQEAVRSKKIDIGMFPQPFAATVLKTGEFKEVFNAKTGVQADEDFLSMMVNPDFLKNNEQAVRDFLSDYVAALKYYNEHGQEARKLLIEKQKVKAEPDVYINMTDNNRSADGKVDPEGWSKIQDVLLQEKWLDKPVDLNAIIDMSYLPN